MRITCESPYDFRLSWRMHEEFSGGSASPEGSLAAWWEDEPVSIRLRQAGRDPAVIEVSAEPTPRRGADFRRFIRAVLNADLRLEPFYRRLRRERSLRPLASSLHGLKPLRPPDIFQMMLTAVSEQQISVRAAQSIRDRLLRAFGTPAGDLIAFPRPRDIAPLDVEKLRACGLSRRKSEYLIELAGKMAAGEMDTGAWEGMPDQELIAMLRGQRGIGEWTAEYILMRGLGRMDVLPASDLGLRRAVGHYLAGGRDLSAREVRGILAPWAPWRGLTAFYLQAQYRA